MSDIEFIDGLIVKAPNPKAPDFVKCSMSIKREQLIAWLQGKSGEWINVDVKESRNGKWYAAVNEWKPKDGQAAQGRAGGGGGESYSPNLPKDDEFGDDIPFVTRNGIY